MVATWQGHNCHKCLNMWFGLLHCLRRSRLTITASTFSGIFGKTVVCFGPMYIVERMQAIYMDERMQIMLILDLLTILGGVSLLWLPHHRRLLAGPPPQVPQVETTWPVSNTHMWVAFQWQIPVYFDMAWLHIYIVRYFPIFCYIAWYSLRYFLRYFYNIWLIVPDILLHITWAHSFGQFKEHVLWNAHTQSPCFSYPGLARAFKSVGLADLSSFGGVSVGWPPDLCTHRNIQKLPQYMQLRDVLAMKAWFKWIVV